MGINYRVMEVVGNLDIVQELQDGFECKCDPEVGFTCRACFEKDTAASAKSIIMMLKDDVGELRERVRELEKVSETCVEFLCGGKGCGSKHSGEMSFQEFMDSGGDSCPLCLTKRVRELEEGIKLHKDLMEQDEHEIYAADEKLWQLIEKQEGGGDE